MSARAVLACVFICSGLVAANTAGQGQCRSFRLPKLGDTVILSSEHWKRNVGVPCQQGRFQLRLTKALGRGSASQLYEAQLQHCTAAAQGFSSGPDTTSSCRQFVDACKLPSALTEPGRRLALRIQHQGQKLPTIEGCDQPWMQSARDMYLRTHTVLSGMSPDAHATTSYLVGDVYAANAKTEGRMEAGIPAQLLKLMDGQDLLSVEGRLGPVDTHVVISQVLRTLVELHNKGWVHQDLHLGQIVCGPRLPSLPKQGHVPDGSIADCAVVDFDQLRFLGNATDMQNPIPGYDHKAPEFFKGRVALTSDVWSLGFAMLTLRTGHPGKYLKGLQSSRESSIRTLARMRSVQPYMRLLQSEWDFIGRCMAYDWKERPTSSKLLADDDFILEGPL